MPLRAIIPRKTKEDNLETLNLNYYRNWQGHQNGNIKKCFHEQIKHLLVGVKFNNPVNVTWRLYKRDKRVSDKSNVYSIQSKFVFDSMTQMGCFPDDNDDFIKTETQLPTRIDKVNPRCTFIFTEVSLDAVREEENHDYC